VKPQLLSQPHALSPKYKIDLLHIGLTEQTAYVSVEKKHVCRYAFSFLKISLKLPIGLSRYFSFKWQHVLSRPVSWVTQIGAFSVHSSLEVGRVFESENEHEPRHGHSECTFMRLNIKRSPKNRDVLILIFCFEKSKINYSKSVQFQVIVLKV
jgi:hypothetical protein